MEPSPDTAHASPLVIRHCGPVLHIQLNRPGAYNALDSRLLEALRDALTRPQDDERVLVLDGGEHAFSVGSDIRELAAMDAFEASAYSRLAHGALAALESWPGLTVAVVGGVVIGAGLELVLGCDLIAGDADARFGMPGLAWALLPVMGGLRHLVGRCGERLAHRLVLEGAILDGDEALAHGLIHRLLDGPRDRQALIVEALEWPSAAVPVIRELRLRAIAVGDVGREAELFAAGFRNGECQRRLRSLIDG